MEKSPPFGPMIRAARLGFRWSPRHGCFIRMADAGEKNVRIDIAPAGGMKGKGFYRCWWETDRDGQDLLDMIPCHRR